jgi:protein-S-isoprenylcysteine O-methyltransferase Ste14
VFSLHLIGRPGTLLSFFGLALFVVGWGIAYLGLRENAFASIVVRHQEERGDAVVDSGIYGIVRHPMHSGIVLLMVSMPLWLESYAGALMASVPVAMIVLRVVLAERFLSRELVDYGAYAGRVRWRLIPFLW